MISGIPDITGIVADILNYISFTNVSQEEIGGARVYDTKPGVLTHYKIDYRRVTDHGRVPMVPMVVGGVTRTVQVAAVSERLVVRWEAEREGGPPEDLPRGGDNEHLNVLTQERMMMQLEQGAEENLIYRISGTIIYQILDPASCPEYWPSPPWIDMSKVDLSQITYAPLF